MRQATKDEFDGKIRQVVDRVVEGLDQPLSPEGLADEAGFSRTHFGRVFARATGETLAGFVRRLRLERAAHQLATTSRSVGEIGLDAGYGSSEAFSKAFRIEFLMNPSEFRQTDLRPEISSPSHFHWLRRDSLCLLFHPENEMQATIVHRPATLVVALRHIGPYHEIGSTFGRLLQECMSLGIPDNVTVAIYHDDPSEVPPQELRSDACLVVESAPSLPEGSELKILTMEEGEFATATHIGSYAGLGDAWSQFMGMAVPALGRPTGHLCFEVYADDCSVTPEEMLRTDLFIQLA